MKNILIVEDEEDMRHALSEALKSYGYNIRVASDGQEGLDLFCGEQFNMVITDVKMPLMNGIDLLKEIRKQNPEIPVIIITAYGSIEDAVNVMKEGAYDYLLKPFSLLTLEKIVENGINRDTASGTHSTANATKKGCKENNKKIVTQASVMKKVLSLAARIAPSPSTVLLQGESGTGKELLARFIHNNSDRSKGPFVAVNCAALPKDLLESELFGYERGAFTGAAFKKIGKFELATKGTILLDEITEMEVSIQAKLLRVLQEQEVDRVGGNKPISINVRVIATTNRSIVQMVEDGKFREDLFFRLNVIPLIVPPLRDRKDDLPFLVDYFIDKHSKRIGKNISGISQEAMAVVMASRWKGNVRELENVVERGVLLCNCDILSLEDLMIDTPGDKPKKARVDTGQTVWEMEKELIVSTLDDVSLNRTKAAERLGISIRTLRNKLKEYKEKNLL